MTEEERWELSKTNKLVFIGITIVAMFMLTGYLKEAVEGTFPFWLGISASGMVIISLVINGIFYFRDHATPMWRVSPILMQSVKKCRQIRQRLLKLVIVPENRQLV